LSDPIPVGSGTAGIALALRALSPGRGWVATSPTVCANVVAAILAGGRRPLFIDIERTTLGLDPELLRAEVSNVDAVIAVHPLGELCQIQEIADVCRAAGVPLIEDCAQAEGATDADGLPVGSRGNVAVFSYGAGKILDLGGGGLVHANSADLRTRIVAQTAVLGDDTDAAQAALDALSRGYKRLYNQSYPKFGKDQIDTFADLLRDAAETGIVAPERDTVERATRARRALQDVVAARRRHQQIYREILTGISGLQFLPVSLGGVPWRFSIWLDSEWRDRVLKQMLAMGKKVSSWHPDITPFLRPDMYRSRALPNSAWYSGGVLNFWLDQTMTEDDVIAAGHEARSFILAAA